MNTPTQGQPPPRKASGRQKPIARADLPVQAFSMMIPIGFRHCDPAGIVFYPRYFEIFQDVIERWFSEALGLDYAHLVHKERIGFGSAHVECAYFTPGFIGDDLRFCVILDHIGSASFHVAIHAYRGDEPVLRGGQVIVTTSLERHGVIPIPEPLRGRLRAYLERLTA